MIFTDEQDLRRGREVVQIYHNFKVGSQGYAPKNIDELAKIINPKNPNLFFMSVGLTSNLLLQNGAFDLADIREKMDDLAENSNQGYPTASTFHNYLTSIAQEGPSFFQSIASPTVDTAKQITQGAQAVGQAVIDTGSHLTKILPIAVVIGALGYIYMKVKKA